MVDDILRASGDGRRVLVMRWSGVAVRWCRVRHIYQRNSQPLPTREAEAVGSPHAATSEYITEAVVVRICSA